MPTIFCCGTSALGSSTWLRSPLICVREYKTSTGSTLDPSLQSRPLPSAAECLPKLLPLTLWIVLFVITMRPLASAAALIALMAPAVLGQTVVKNVTFNTFYDNPNNSMDGVACSDGINGLITTRASQTFHSLSLHPSRALQNWHRAP